MFAQALALLLLAHGAAACGQVAPAPLQPVSPLLVAGDTLSLKRGVRNNNPFTVAGPHGLIAGQQDGSFEAWILPVKLLSHFQLRAQVQSYPVPIELNPAAAEIEVFPDRTVITYTHIALTVRQTMFAPVGAAPGTGAVVLFEISSVRPVELTFSFTPEMRPMWPKPSQGEDSEWVAEAGAYLLHTDFPNLAGAVAMPETQPGIMAPFQEKPQTHPLQLVLHYDPVRDRGKAYPLMMAVGQTPETATKAALLGQLHSLNGQIAELYRQHAATYSSWQANLTSIDTPDAGLNDSFRWAELAIEQLRTAAQPEPGAKAETALVAGYFSSGDSARPGFGWFFGRDALYTLYAVNGMGDFSLSRDELSFLIARQRADGKIMHEYSQTAASIDWRSLPYMYAAADATPLFLLAMLDYVQASGDMEFLKLHRDAVLKAWDFERRHDSDGDGVYDNEQGTGWVESWPGGQPHQEIYLALLDRQSSSAVATLAALLDEPALSRAAQARAAALRTTIEAEYYLPAEQRYAFSRNADGSLDKARTVYPALAWWSDADGLAHAEASLQAWDSHDFSTDWGIRDVAESDPVYDPISYHQGSVWPLFTGWAALADYRSGHPLSGYAHLMQNAQQTYTQDLGAVTELLSGAFFTPFGRSTSHQLWSSAMVITPALRGLFGLRLDARMGLIELDPHLPADWPEAWVRNVHVGSSLCDLHFERVGRQLSVTVTPRSGPVLRLTSRLSPAQVTEGRLLLPLPEVEVAVPQALPLPGARTAQIKVLSEQRTAHSLTLQVEGTSAAAGRLLVRNNTPASEVHAEGITLSPGPDGLLEGTVEFPGASTYQQKTIKLTW